jgi:hypothetical protein
MTQGLLYRLLICILTIALFLYALIDKQNAITQLEIYLPILSAEVKELQEKNAHLEFAIEQAESPGRLLALLKEKEFSHLTYPKQIQVAPAIDSKHHDQAKS